MEQLDGLAVTLGATVCSFLTRRGHDTVNDVLCSDGYYSAGWRLLTTILVVLGVLFVWYGIGHSSGRKI